MKKSLPLLGFLVLMLSTCGRYPIVEYQPNPNDKQPKTTIERVIRAQPQPWGIVPYKVSAKDDCIDMMMLEERKLHGKKFNTEVSKIVCYKNIGRVVLLRYPEISHVEIYDSLGYRMYTVNCYDEADARALIDALYTMKGSLR